jgi:hypothetical protein
MPSPQEASRPTLVGNEREIGLRGRLGRFFIALAAPLRQTPSHLRSQRDCLEQTDMVSLVQAGFSHDEVVSLFARLSTRCGKA